MASRRHRRRSSSRRRCRRSDPANGAARVHTEPAAAVGTGRRYRRPQRSIARHDGANRITAADQRLGRAIAAIHKDLDEIRHQLTDAQPRHVVQSLENEAQALAQRIDYSRDAGVDPAAVAGIERGLAEVRDALHGLTPAESLAGFDDTVRSLAQKVDLIIAREDPAALEQLETAIGALRGIVSHVASNDTLTGRRGYSLASRKVDELAHGAVSGQAMSALENRIETLTDALSASAEAGHAVPHELEKLLSGLIEKLEWVQLTYTDQAALGNLEDRIAKLMKRLDASDAKLGNLEAIERGLADLLVHLDQVRGGSATEPKRGERRTQNGFARSSARHRGAGRRPPGDDRKRYSR